MTANTQTAARAETGLGAILAAAFIGAALIFAAGFANSAAIHDAAHDARHAISFPCH